MAASRMTDPRRLDVAAFAAAGGELGGQWPLGGFARLATATLPPGSDAPPVHWRIRGQRAALAGAGVSPALAIDASAAVVLECQRCLQPLAWPLQVERRIFFVESEDAAAALDADSDDDVLALTPAVDAHALVEDELLLALPIGPRHETCAAPLPVHGLGEADAEAPQAEHPFAALAALKRGPRPN